MFRVSKVLSHNAVLAVSSEDQKKYLILGKGIGFGKKVSERLDTGADTLVYSLTTADGKRSEDSLKKLDPVYIELADYLIKETKAAFEKVDQTILLPLADHIAFAVYRLKKGETISNPLTQDIRLLFHSEYKIAEKIREPLLEKTGIALEDDEIGYIALHIHSSLEKEAVSQAMQVAGAVRECVSCVEEHLGKNINVCSLSYNRLMNHVRFMVVRSIQNESLKVNMNDYVEHRFKESYKMAEEICRKIESSRGCKLDKPEIGYLAMHIERIMADERGFTEEE